MTSISSGASSVGSWGNMPPPPRMQGAGKQGVSVEGQGSVSMEEMFSKLDSDGDGSISQTELESGLKSSSSSAEQSAASSRGSGQNAFGGMGMDTQNFASMMGGGLGGGMPLPPPPSGAQGGMQGGLSLDGLDSDEDGSITKAEFGLTDSTSGSASTETETSSTEASSSSQQTQQALFDMIDGDGSGDLSKTELSSFQDKMKALFEKMQQMGMQQMSAANNSNGGNAAGSISFNA